MIIHEANKSIFIHNPKCGGTFFQKNYRETHTEWPRYLYWRLWGPEDNVDLTHITLRELPRFVPEHKDYKLFSFIRNPYNRFVSAIKTACEYDDQCQKLMTGLSGSTRSFCEFLLTQDYEDQDNFLRNPARPWFLPQSYFYDPNDPAITAFRFESKGDWAGIFDRFAIVGQEVVIPRDYDIDDETRMMIKTLYFDDYKIFDLYGL